MLLRCAKCNVYTMQTACPTCGLATTRSGPAKYSPEDAYGRYRRQLKKMDRAKAGG